MLAYMSQARGFDRQPAVRPTVAELACSPLPGSGASLRSSGQQRLVEPVRECLAGHAVGAEENRA